MDMILMKLKNFTKDLSKKKGKIYSAKFCNSNSEPQQVQCRGAMKEQEILSTIFQFLMKFKNFRKES